LIRIAQKYNKVFTSCEPDAEEIITGSGSAAIKTRSINPVMRTEDMSKEL
jgi:hypothetical protein